jgi:hypothetical protein
MDHKTRVLNALTHREVDRPPFDLFDECGSLFTASAYDPALRVTLSPAAQVEARIRFQAEFDTDLIFDAPVLGASEAKLTAGMAGDAGASWEIREAFFPLTACLWMPWSPHLVAKPAGSAPDRGPGGSAVIEYDIDWDNGLHLPLFLETASGNPSGYELLMRDRGDWPRWKQVFTPDFGAFDYSLLRRMIAATRGEVAMYGTVTGPFGALTLLLGLEAAATVFLDDRRFADELMGFFTDTAIEVCRDMFRHGVDVVRIGGASTAVLGPRLYEEFVLPYHRRFAAAIRQAGGLSIFHCCGHVNAMLESFAAAGWDGLEPLTPPPLGDTTLADAWRRIGGRVCLKGNLDPVHVMRFGTPDAVAEQARRCLRIGGRKGGYILSVADCMAPGTPREHMQIVSEVAHQA